MTLSVVDLEALRVLDKAANLIEEKGLAKTVYWDPAKDTFCTWGAFIHQQPHPTNTVERRAISIFEDYLRKHYKWAKSHPTINAPRLITVWNDKKSRTKKQVVNELRNCVQEVMAENAN